MKGTGTKRPGHGWIRVDEQGRVRHADDSAQDVLGICMGPGDTKYVADLIGGEPLPPRVFVRCVSSENRPFLARSQPIRSGGRHIEVYALGQNDATWTLDHRQSDARLAAQCLSWHSLEQRHHFEVCGDPLAIYGWNAPQMIVGNAALSRLLGRPMHELIGLTGRQLVPLESQALVARTSSAQHRDGRTRRPCPVITSGGPLWTELTLVRYQHEGVDLQAAMYTSAMSGPSDSLITIDPSEVMASADRLALMGQLAIGVAHEMSTPASWVTGNLTLLGQELGASHPQMHLIEESLEGMQRISSLMNTLRAFGNTQPSPHTSTSVNDVVEEALALVGNHLRHNAVLNVDLGDAGQVMANPSQLTQVVANLLTNAAQAADARQPQHFIRVCTFTKGGQAIIEVSDNGTGIPDEIRARIFEPFFTTRAFGEASGLGLAAALQITTHHKGTLAVDSNTEGTRFRVRLPQVSGIQPSTDRATWKPGACGNRVLVVDDEPMLLRVIRRLLKRIATVEIATGGRDAIHRLERDPPYDLVLCDLMMPGVDGHAVYEWITQNQPDLIGRTHFLSGGAFTKESIAFVKTHKINLINKPVNPSKLIALVQTHMAVQD